MQTTKRYIFLDIDGVLNSEAWYTHLWDTHSQNEIHNMDFNTYNLDTRAISLLNQLSGCEVVISSSWRYCTETVDGLKKAGLALPIIGGIEHGYVGSDYLVRGNYIAKWFSDKFGEVPWDYLFSKDGFYHTKKTFSGPVGSMTENPLPSDSVAISYVILDDDNDMLLWQRKHFVEIDSRFGLTQEHIDKCKKILKL